MNEERKVLKTLSKAMATCNGVNDTVAMLYGANDTSASASAFVGNGDVLCASLVTVLSHVGEGRATPAEMAITRAVLIAVAATDEVYKGALQSAIDGYRDQLLTSELVLKKFGESDV